MFEYIDKKSNDGKLQNTTDYIWQFIVVDTRVPSFSRLINIMRGCVNVIILKLESALFQGSWYLLRIKELVLTLWLLKFIECDLFLLNKTVTLKEYKSTVWFYERENKLPWRINAIDIFVLSTILKYSLWLSRKNGVKELNKVQSSWQDILNYPG